MGFMWKPFRSSCYNIYCSINKLLHQSRIKLIFLLGNFCWRRRIFHENATYERGNYCSHNNNFSSSAMCLLLLLLVNNPSWLRIFSPFSNIPDASMLLLPNSENFYLRRENQDLALFLWINSRNRREWWLRWPLLRGFTNSSKPFGNLY